MLNLTESQKTQEIFSKQVPKNLLANIMYFVLNVIIGLFLVPYFIDSLGVASYALIPLATSLTSYVNLVMQSLNLSVSRYLTIDLQSKEFKKANITFNTALFVTLGVILLILPFVVLISYYAPSFFDIPTNQENTARILFLGVISSFLLRAWGSNFGVSFFALNRLDLQNIINSINIIIQVALIIIFFSIYTPRLSYIGYSYFIAAVVTFFLTVVLSKKINPHFKVNIHDFRLSQVKDLGITGGWITIDQIGTLLLFQIDIIVINKLFGTVAGGEYSIILMWNTLIRSAAGMLAGVLTPVILACYARKKFEELVVISKNAVKIMGLSMALPIGLICGFSPLILSLWVGPEFSRLSPLMWLLLSHLSINMSVLPLFPINVSYNKVRIPAIVTIFSGIVNLLLAVTLSLKTGCGYYGVAFAGAIVLTARHFFFVPMYATRVLGASKIPFKSSMIQVVLSTLTVSGITSIIYHFLNITNVVSLIICCGIISLVYLPMIWFGFMNQSERRIIESLIPQKFMNILRINVHCD